MKATYEMAEKVAGYYCEVRALEDELTDDEMMSGEHPDWDERQVAIAEQYPLTEEEEALLTHVLEMGLCDYFTAEDVMSVL